MDFGTIKIQLRMFTIGKLATRGGVSIQTIRYYESRGILVPVLRRQTGFGARVHPGYRLYDELSLKRLKFIRKMQELGFKLDEIKRLLELKVEPMDACVEIKEKVDSKIRNVDERIKSLRNVKKVLLELSEACYNRHPTEECPILRTIEDKDL